MKFLISGSRTFPNKSLVIRTLTEKVKSNDILITGGAIGVDTIAIEWASRNNIECKIIRPIDKTKKIDYLFRNCIMVGMADELICFWDGKSRGTKFTYDQANFYNLNTHMVRCD
jgi:YspA, cpYpsA-related SLOG family